MSFVHDRRRRGMPTPGDGGCRGDGHGGAANWTPGSVSTPRCLGASSERSGVPRSPNKRLTGERPQQGVTPDSLLALHEAGYRAVLERIGDGRILDVGCGQGFESARFLSPDRQVVGADYSADAVATAAARYGAAGLEVAQMDALRLGFLDETFDGACSSH